MLNINEVTICGCLGRDPDLRYGTNNLAFVTLPVATNRRVKGADGNYQSITDWNNVVAFGKTARRLPSICTRGRRSGYVAVFKRESTKTKTAPTDG